MRKLLQNSTAATPETDPPPSDSSSSASPPPSGGNSTNPQPSPPRLPDEDLSADPQSQPESASNPWEPPTRNQHGNEKIVIAAAVGLVMFFIIIIIIVLICLCCHRRKKRNDRDYDRKHFHQYGHPNYADRNYYMENMGGQRHWQNNTPYMDGKKRPPPPPGSSMNREYWMAGPSPSPPPTTKMNAKGTAQSPVAWGVHGRSRFSYNELAAATNEFSQENLLGQGGFGYVHKGVLPDGKEVAVKSLKLNSSQGEREFQAEVDIISRVHHRHLVSLVGYCISGSQRMLVYEFVPNSSLEDHLHGSGRPCMDCAIRIKIALGAAKGFAYLHEDCHPRIIHRDIKAANILLDNNCEAKVADFGLAKLSSDESTHISTRIMGTFGYLAPEYASRGKLTEKSDVYSFGIVLLELITGRRPVDVTKDDDDDDSLVDWARPILMKMSEGGGYRELVDPRLENNFDHGQMLRMVTAAAACIRTSARRRPKMSQVVRALEGDVSLDDLNEVMRVRHGSLSSSSSEYDFQRYNLGGGGGGSDTHSECSLSQSSATHSNELISRFSPAAGDRSYTP